MATQTYTVKKGDTLSKIASDYGVGMDKITGYKSGNPDLIYEGETINIGDKAPQATGTPTYSETVKNALTSEDTKEKNPYDVYGVDSLRKNLDTIKTSKDTAFKDLEGAQTKTWNDEYNTSGLSEKKQKISTLDQEIADAKRQRDEYVAQVRGNSGLSASQMTGDIRKALDYQNNLIQNKIAERNGIATEYNSGLGEIDKKVGRSVADKKLLYDKYNTDEASTTKKITEYLSALKSALSEQGKNDRYDKQLANALEVARLRKSGGSTAKLKPMKDWSGNITGWYDDFGNIYDKDGTIKDNGEDITPPASNVDEGEEDIFKNETTPETVDNQDQGGVVQWLLNYLRGI